MAGPKQRKKLKKKLSIPRLPIVGTLEAGFGTIFKNAALQGFKKLIKQGYSEKEAIKMLKNPTKGKD